MSEPLNANTHNAFYRQAHPSGRDSDTCCYPTPEDWCRRLGTNYQAMYGYGFADAAVFVANLFMLAFAIESLVRSDVAGEACEYPLGAFVAVQCLFITVLQLVVPVINAVTEGPRTNRRPPTCALVLHLLQVAWLVMGWYWSLSQSDW